MVSDQTETCIEVAGHTEVPKIFVVKGRKEVEVEESGTSGKFSDAANQEQVGLCPVSPPRAGSSWPGGLNIALLLLGLEATPCSVPFYKHEL